MEGTPGDMPIGPDQDCPIMADFAPRGPLAVRINDVAHDLMDDKVDTERVRRVAR